MRALCWHGKNDVRVDTVPDPEIQEPTDAIIKITSTAICGSDLHLYDGFMMGMEKGDVLGHEPMGIVVEVGSSVTKLKRGDRVVVPFVIACGHCFFCTKQLYACCDTTNPDPEKMEKIERGQIDPSFIITHRLPLEEAPAAYKTFRDKEDGCIKSRAEAIRPVSPGRQVQFCLSEKLSLVLLLALRLTCRGRKHNLSIRLNSA
jgi:threonine dehydrogenase-like Zn-dependent dehydrogenase